MERGLYIAAAGMLAEMVRQDQITNDMANVATPGYKADRAAQRSFDDVLLENTRTGQEIGRLGHGPVISAQVTDFSPAELKATGEPLDLAVAGEGFFAVQTDKGIRYTRDGKFQQAADGTLTDQLGHMVVGRDGKAVAVGADGTVDTSRVGLFRLTTASKIGDDFTTGTVGGTPTGTIRSGALEASGVDAGRTMVDLMASLRAFEAGQKAITTIDSTLQLAAGQVGNLPG
jgi:flagellar basal-body rod protein FlgF